MVRTSPFHGGNMGSNPVEITNALVAESVDVADLKSVGIYPVPVQVWPSAPIKKCFP